MNYPDGYLVPDLHLRRDVTRIIRQEQPDILMTCDPTNLYVRRPCLIIRIIARPVRQYWDAVFPAAPRSPEFR